MPLSESSARALALADMRATIAAHVPDDDGVCVACRQDGDDEMFPCRPFMFARRAADMLTRRLTRGDSARGITP